MTADLADLQDRFAKQLLQSDGDALDGQLAADGALFEVYGDAYVARLIEALSEEFEGLHTLLGDEGFADAIRAYVATHPSTTPSVRWFGRHLPAWLAETEPWSEHRELAAMASFEWMLGLAFDAPDAPLLSVAEIGAAPPEAWPMLTFTFHPALNTAPLSHDVAPFHQAVRDEVDPDVAPAPFPGPQPWVAWRDPGTLMVMHRGLDPDEAAALAAAREGVTFDGICEKIADLTEADNAAFRAASLLRGWIESGWVIGLDAEGMSW